MIKYYSNINGATLAEILPESDLISNPEDILDIMVDAAYNNASGLIVHSITLHKDFFDLKTGLAGEILQKFSNYRMRLAIIGDISAYKSKSLRDFIVESNNRGTICFVDSLDKALLRLN